MLRNLTPQVSGPLQLHRQMFTDLIVIKRGTSCSDLCVLQIDGSTLRTLCMQHGPLITFHLSLAQGNALVRYSSKEEAAKAQKSLHM